MFFEKLKSKYSYNFFGICGYLNLLILLYYAVPCIISKKSGCIDIIGLALILCTILSLIYAAIAFVVGIIEHFLNKEIKNEFVIKNIYWHYLINIGSVLTITLWVLMLYMFIRALLV